MNQFATVTERFNQVLEGTWAPVPAYSVTQGHFRRMPEDQSPDSIPASIAERAIRLTLGAPIPKETVNGYDTYGLYNSKLKVYVTYAYTNAGGDMSEGLSPQHGSATQEDLQDRWAADSHAIHAALEWHENHADLTPFVMSVQLKEIESDLEFFENHALGVMTFNVFLYIDFPGRSLLP